MLYLKSIKKFKISIDLYKYICYTIYVSER